ncbi:MAG: hypothetical protein GY769_10865 [bacterium]|nr:hypothetical protein [bacterium]
MRYEAPATQGLLSSIAVFVLTLNLAPSWVGASSIGLPDRADPREPAKGRSADVQARPFEIQGHRGGAGLAPENSMAAFEKAISLGVDTLEMDTQSTSDRVLVVSHDQKIGGNCRRIDGGTLGSRFLMDLSLEDVKAIRCEGEVAIPTLEAVLRLAHAAPYAVRANVELKMQKASRGIPVEEFAALLVDVIDATGMRGRTLVQSFDAEALRYIRRIAPDIPRAVIARDRDSYLAMVEDTTASALLPRRDRLEREDVEALHARGVAVIPWVVDDPEEMRRLRSWGVDGIITNRPDVALDVRNGPRRRSADVEASLPPPTPWPPPTQPTPPSASPAQITPEVTRDAYDISEVRKVAVYYFTSDGRMDSYLTSVFVEELRNLRVHEAIDPYELADQPRDGEQYHPAGKLDALFEEAGLRSAEAIIIGVGKWYRPGGLGRGFRLEVRLIEARGGRVLWQETAASGGTFSGPPAKREVVRKVLRSYPGGRRR